MSEGLILEGIPGTGKSKTLEALLKLSPYSGWRVFREEETFGELMDQLKDPALSDEDRWERLEGVLAKPPAGQPRRPRALRGQALMPNQVNLPVELSWDRQTRQFVAKVACLDVATCGRTRGQALRNAREAAELFLEGLAGMGTLEDVLSENGWREHGGRWTPPATQTVIVQISAPRSPEKLSAPPSSPAC